VFGSTIAQIPLSLWVPFTLIVVFVAVMLALPLDCIRNPLWLLPPGLAVLLMIIGVAAAPFAFIAMSAPLAVVPVVLAALTALPPGELTMTPGSSVRFIGLLVAVVS
jgi:hypothetical protein